MRKITNKRHEQIRERIEKFANKLQGLESLAEKLTDEIEDLIQTVKDENGDTFNDLIQDIRDEQAEIYDDLNEIADDAEMYYDDRSEKWHESENGELYDEWKNKLRDFCEKFDGGNEFFEVEVDSDHIDEGQITINVSIEDSDLNVEDFDDDLPQEPDTW